MIHYIKNPDTKLKKHNYDTVERDKEHSYRNMMKYDQRPEVENRFRQKPYYLEIKDKYENLVEEAKRNKRKIDKR